MAYRLTGPARKHIKDILKYSEHHYGVSGAQRYKLLIEVAIARVAIDPSVHGSRPVPEFAAAREYEIRHARMQVPRDQRIANPWHKIVYRVAKNGVVEILAVVGLSMPSEHSSER